MHQRTPTHTRIFLCSTDYDLRDLRSTIKSHLKSLGYEVIAFEDGSMPVHSANHSYDNCIRAARECDYLVAIIDRRFGGTLSDGRSITQAEIDAAFDAGKQVIVFVREAVWAARHVDRENRRAGMGAVAINNIVDDRRVFDLIDAICGRSAGNWIFQFKTPQDITKTLDAQITPVENAHEALTESVASTPNDRRFLESLTPEELSGLVLVPLLREMSYHDIVFNSHGTNGCLLFAADDPLNGPTYCSAIPIQRSITSRQDIDYAHGQVRTISAPTSFPGRRSPVIPSQLYLFTAFELDESMASEIGKAAKELGKQLSIVAGDRLLALIDQYLPTLLRSLPNPEARYLFTLCQRIINSPTLARLGANHTPAILKVYTGGSLVRTTYEEAAFISFARPETATISVGLSLSDILQHTKAAAVIADVGAGKTTLLHKLVLDVVDNANSHGRPARLTPLLISLASIPERSLKRTEDLAAFIEWQLRVDDKLDSFSLLDGSRYILMLDGFDELRGSHTLVEQYIATLPDIFAGVVVTSRPSRIPRLPATFSLFRLQPFRDIDIQDFLHKWFADDEELRSVIWDKLANNNHLKEFCRTPLILTLYSVLAANTEEHEDLPVRRTDIYRNIMSLLLGRWDRARNVVSQFSPDIKQYVLERLAFECHTKQLRTFSSEKFFKVSDDAIRSSGVGGSPDGLMAEIVYRSSLVRTDNSRQYTFAHLSFQEFLVAEYLRRQGVHSGSATFDISKYLDDEWWKGAFIFYFGLIRTLDGISIGKKKRLQKRGIGLRLMEFLVEADFTSLEMRQDLARVLGDELLGAAKLTSGELAVCEQLGDSIVTVLEAIVNGSSFSGSCTKYFTVLRQIRTKRSIEGIWRGGSLLSRLQVDALSQELQENMDLITDEEGVKVLLEGLDVLGYRCRVSADNVANLVACSSALLTLESGIQQVTDRFARDRAIRSKVRSAWSKFASVVATKALSMQSVGAANGSDLRRICQALVLVCGYGSRGSALGILMELFQRLKRHGEAGKSTSSVVALEECIRRLRKAPSGDRNILKTCGVKELLAKDELWIA